MIRAVTTLRGNFLLAMHACERVNNLDHAPHFMAVNGALAQLVERFAGSEEVRGSTPLGSTNLFPQTLRFP